MRQDLMVQMCLLNKLHELTVQSATKVFTSLWGHLTLYLHYLYCYTSIIQTNAHTYKQIQIFYSTILSAMCLYSEVRASEHCISWSQQCDLCVIVVTLCQPPLIYTVYRGQTKTQGKGEREREKRGGGKKRYWKKEGKERVGKKKRAICQQFS